MLRLLLFLLLRMALILFLMETTTKACMEVERNALLAFKASIIADPAHRLSSWHRQTNCCKWSGVLCDNITGHVVQLNLQNSLSSDWPPETALKGEMVSPSLLSLTHLDRLNLRGNDFSGIQIPEFIGSFNKLRYLDLSYANFSGFTVPPQFANLSTTLLHLALSANQFDGIQIPEFMGSFNKLRYLDISCCSFSGSIPPHLVNLSTTLRHLDLSGNYDLTNNNLQWLSHFSSLRFLDLSYVTLSKVSHNWLPQVISMLPSLRELHLSTCDLHSKPYDSSFSYANLTSLTTLDLGGNHFNYSTLPNWLWKLKKLSYLDLGDSEFSGTIPEDIGNLTSLTYLDLAYNDWEGVIPTSIANLSNLETLILRNCNWKGELPHWLTQLTSLTHLDLTSNLFTGDLPDLLPQMTNLTLLNLSNNSLTGPLPTNIGKLSNLNYLDLSFNFLQGYLTELHFSNLFNLNILELSFNSLQGYLTELHFANLTRLVDLSLSGNSLTISVDQNWTPPFQLKGLKLGSCKVGPRFPRWLQSQTSIYELNLSNTNIIDTLPDWFWTSINFRAPKIIVIDLSHNKISGILPTFWENMTGLQFLNLGSNLFQGPLPSSFPPFLGALDLSSNSLSGPLPSNLSSNMPNLEFLHLSDNSINGSIPSYLCDMDWLQVLGVSSNHLSGEIPNCWRASQQLSFLDLANNELSGEIPTSIGYLIQIQYLHLNNNSLHGRLPSTLQNCSQLAILDLGDNKFSDTIPLWIGQSFQYLEVLRLRSNMFTGNIPSELGQLSNLQIIDLANNKLSGTLPNSFGNFSSMIFMVKSMSSTITPDAGLFGFLITISESVTIITKGSQFSFSSILKLVKSIDISNNSLTGMIPEEIGSLSALQTLNLSRNNFLGTIPETIGGMKSLETLDLSFNMLSGDIPQSLSTVNFLNHLNLSYNNLSGIIPSGNQFQTLNDASIYIGNTYLCGAPTNRSCSVDKNVSVAYEEHDERSQKLSFYLGVALGFLIGLWSIFVILLFQKNWRYSYFRLIDQMYDNAYVAIKIRIARLTIKG